MVKNLWQLKRDINKLFEMFYVYNIIRLYIIKTKCIYNNIGYIFVIVSSTLQMYRYIYCRF